MLRNKLQTWAILPFLLLAPTLYSCSGDDGGQCSHCESADDCNEGLGCYWFSDGSTRCASKKGDKCTGYSHLAPDPADAGRNDTSGQEQHGSMCVADFNGDDIPDVVLVDRRACRRSIEILLSTSDGAYSEWRDVWPNPPSGAVSAEDMNHDGCMDIVIELDAEGRAELDDEPDDGKAVALLVDGEPCPRRVLFGNGDGTFSPSAAD